MSISQSKPGEKCEKDKLGEMKFFPWGLLQRNWWENSGKNADSGVCVINYMNSLKIVHFWKLFSELIGYKQIGTVERIGMLIRSYYKIWIHVFSTMWRLYYDASTRTV